jgi:hypothetical protein
MIKSRDCQRHVYFSRPEKINESLISNANYFTLSLFSIKNMDWPLTISIKKTRDDIG